MTEFATPTMNRKDPLIAEPNVYPDQQIHAVYQKAGHTNNAPHPTHATQFGVDICTNRNSYVLKIIRLTVSLKVQDLFGHTTIITIVLWPSEKYKPQVTGSWPMWIKLLVALSIALRRRNYFQWEMS